MKIGELTYCGTVTQKASKSYGVTLRSIRTSSVTKLFPIRIFSQFSSLNPIFYRDIFLYITFFFEIAKIDMNLDSFLLLLNFFQFLTSFSMHESDYYVSYSCNGQQIFEFMNLTTFFKNSKIGKYPTHDINNLRCL